MKNRPSTKKKHPSIGVAAVLSVFLVLIGCICAGGFIVATQWLQDLPDYKDQSAYLDNAEPSIIYASDGVTELAKFQLEDREPVEKSAISPYVLAGTVATEDERFYNHNGVDMLGLGRALVNNVSGGSIEGASTITQQLVRNTVLLDEMNDISIKRKVREAYIALEMEKQFSKDDILVMYLNTVNYGSGAYGIEAASQRYFSKHASELTLPEAALLAGIPQSPTYNDPINYPENAKQRRNTVLDRMLKNGYISQEEHDQAVMAPIELNVHTNPDDGILAYPYFTSYVRNLLYNRYGFSESDVYEGGLRIYTTLDIDMQNAAEDAAAAKRDSLGGDLDVAMAVVEPSTGYIKAIVGGADYYTNEVNIATGDGSGGRPCGSAFKVFTLVTALEQGISPQTYLDCGSPATIDNYTVQNYDNINYGTRTIERALAVSSNTGFVRLIASMGPTKVAETASKMGISSKLSPNTAGTTLTLGVENVTPLEMAEAYATIANGGMHYDSTPVTTIKNRDGVVVVDNTDPAARGERVLSEEVAYAAEKVMEKVVNSSEGTGTDARLSSGQVVAGKTGTTESYRDITFFGITPQLSVGIWCGDPSNVETVPVGTACADVFRDFAEVALGDDVEPWPVVDAPKYTNYTDNKYHIYGTGYQASSNYGQSTGTNNGNGTTNADGTAAGANGNNGATGATGNGTGNDAANGATNGGTVGGGTADAAGGTGADSGTAGGGGATGGATAGAQ